MKQRASLKAADGGGDGAGAPSSSSDDEGPLGRVSAALFTPKEESSKPRVTLATGVPGGKSQPHSTSGGADDRSQTDTIERNVSPGQSFGEGALLMHGAVCDARYQTGASGATLLEVPRHLFFQMLLRPSLTLFGLL